MEQVLEPKINEITRNGIWVEINHIETFITISELKYLVKEIEEIKNK